MLAVIQNRPLLIYLLIYKFYPVGRFTWNGHYLYLFEIEKFYVCIIFNLIYSFNTCDVLNMISEQFNCTQYSFYVIIVLVTVRGPVAT